MKIGFYGNANNLPFMLARALRRLGHEVEFIVASRFNLNRPEFRYRDVSSPYPPWIHDLSHRLRWRLLLPGRSRTRAIAILNSCDFALLNEEGPALARHLRVPYGVYFTGSDLEIFADPDKAEVLKPGIFTRSPWLTKAGRLIFPSAMVRRLLIEPQREGIRRARFVTWTPPGLLPNGDRLLDGLQVERDRRLWLLMADTLLIPYSPPPQNPVLQVFNSARLTWKNEPGSDLTVLDYKGTDRVIRGLALFKNRYQVPLNIRLVQTGRHVSETRQLVDSLGLSNHVTWLDYLTQIHFRDELKAADIVIDQVADGIVAMSGLEAMAVGRPLIANARAEVITPVLGAPSPICHASNAEEVCAQLHRLTLSTEERVRVGLAGRAYVEKHFSADVVAAMMLKSLAKLGGLPARPASETTRAD